MRVWFGYIHRRGGVGWATGRARSRSAWNNRRTFVEHQRGTLPKLPPPAHAYAMRVRQMCALKWG